MVDLSPSLAGRSSDFQAKSILAVIVLYKRKAEDSESFSSLRALLGQNDDTPAIDLMVCDNTPYEQSPPDGFTDLYVRDPSNPGLARCYNVALKVAEERSIPWLLLLDQDTTLTREFLDECLAEADRLQGRTEVVAIVPKLSNRGLLCSPHFRPFLGPARSIEAQAGGVASQKLFVFNSGAAMRVEALRSIGGFPDDYPLDFLDHATFAALQNRGGKLFLLRSTLVHDLSTNDHGRHDPALVPRQIGMLDAEYRFYRQYGSSWDRLLRRLRLMRGAAGRIARGKNWEQSWRILKSAFRP